MKSIGMNLSIKFRCARRNFTLVELLTAMAVLSILMLMLFQFFSSAQRAWSAMETNTRIYENARIVLEVITRDLQSAVASNEDGRKIPFYVGPDGAGGVGNQIGFISRVEGNNDVQADLCEIVYSWTNVVGSPNYQYQFRRSRVCDRNSGGAVNNAWDFYNKTDASWVTTGLTPQQVIPGVLALSFTCVYSLPNPYTSTNPTTNYIIDANRAIPVLPKAVLVNLTLCDEKLLNAPAQLRDRSKRTFTKMIYLNSSN